MPIPSIDANRVRLTMLTPEDGARVARYQRDNREHFAPWEPPRPAEFFTDQWWCRRLADERAEFANDQSARFQVLDKATGDMIGACNFTAFARGGFQACRLGYSIAQSHEGQGYMSDALRAAIPFVFDELRMHRIMANYVPENERSGRLLAALGFAVEGRASDYLFIGGRWRDHVLTALTNPDPREPGV